MWKYYYLCKTIDKLYAFISRQFDKEFRLLGQVRILQYPYVPNGWFVTHLYASIAQCARSKTIAHLKTNPSCDRNSIRRRVIYNLRTCRIGCEVGLDFYQRAERASNDTNCQAILKSYITLHIFPVIT